MSAPSDQRDRMDGVGEEPVDPSGVACGGWDNSDCTGTPLCPPRCPRFVDKEGNRFLIRPIVEGDRERLAETYSAFGTADRAQGIPPADERRRHEWIDQLCTEGRNVVAEAEDGRLLGHAVYTPSDAPVPELAVFVHPDHHGRGLGTELCRHVIAEAAESGREQLNLYVEATNRAAITVYRRLGFEVVDRGIEIRMELPLDEPIAMEVREPPARQHA